MSHQCYQQEKAKWSHTAQWTLLFLTRIKSGLLYLHQNSETRTKTHHQRKPKILRKNAYPKHHVQALTTLFAVRTLKERQDFWSNFVIVGSTFESHYLDDFWIWIKKMSKNHRDARSRKSNRQIPTKRIDWSQHSEEAWGATNHKNTEKQHLHRQYEPPVLPKKKEVDHNAQRKLPVSISWLIRCVRFASKIRNTDQKASSTETKTTPKKNIPKSPYSGINTPFAGSTLERGQNFWSNNWMNQK